MPPVSGYDYYGYDASYGYYAGRYNSGNYYEHTGHRGRTNGL